MRALLLALLVAVAAPARAQSVIATPRPRTVRLAVGSQLGFPHLFGLSALATFHWRERPRFDVDFLWEPSAFLQSYSVGAAYHPADRMFFLGTRLRLLQFRAPWGRGYDAETDNHLGIGLEGGLRAPLGWQKRIVVCFTLQGTAVPTQVVGLQWLFGLNLGVSWVVLDRAHR
jgi:hypothetical protein